MPRQTTVYLVPKDSAAQADSLVSEYHSAMLGRVHDVSRLGTELILRKQRMAALDDQMRSLTQQIQQLAYAMQTESFRLSGSSGTALELHDQFVQVMDREQTVKAERDEQATLVQDLTASFDSDTRSLATEYNRRMTTLAMRLQQLSFQVARSGADGLCTFAKVPADGYTLLAFPPDSMSFWRRAQAVQDHTAIHLGPDDLTDITRAVKDK